MESVYVFKLTTGDELIGKVVKSDSDYFELADAKILMVGARGDLQLAPVMFAHDAKKNITIKTNHIVSFSSTPEPQFEEAYRSSTSSIITPKPTTSKIITG